MVIRNAVVIVLEVNLVSEPRTPPDEHLVHPLLFLSRLNQLKHLAIELLRHVWLLRVQLHHVLRHFKFAYSDAVVRIVEVEVVLCVLALLVDAWVRLESNDVLVVRQTVDLGENELRGVAEVRVRLVTVLRITGLFIPH